MLESFFTEERVHGGWRFWVIWVILTNIGFFAGLLVEMALGSISLILAVPLAAVFQAWAMNRHIVILIPWILVTAIGWWVGMAIMSLILYFVPNELHPIARLMIVSAGAGFIVGIPQWRLLRNQVSQIGIWWIPLSAVSWALLVPGILEGIPLARYIEYDYRDLVYRTWIKPEDASQKPTSAKTKVVQP